jgi:hypothetical protein
VGFAPTPKVEEIQSWVRFSEIPETLKSRDKAVLYCIISHWTEGIRNYLMKLLRFHELVTSLGISTWAQDRLV